MPDLKDAREAEELARRLLMHTHNGCTPLEKRVATYREKVETRMRAELKERAA